MIRAAVALAVLAAAPTAIATAAQPPAGMEGDFRCFAGSASRGTLALGQTYDQASDQILATTYEYAGGSGHWSWDGSAASFAGGPLESAQGLYFPGHRAMPNDTQPGRTYTVVLRMPDGTSTYCGVDGHPVRSAIAGVARYVQRAARIPVRLPLWFDTPGQPKPHIGHVVVARRGLYRIDFRDAGCKGPASSCEDGVFSGKRAPASDLGHRRRVKLGHGVVGWVGTYGCAFNGTDPDWGPLYCGRNAIVWHQAGVNYCLESRDQDEADLVVEARQAVAS